MRYEYFFTDFVLLKQDKQWIYHRCERTLWLSQPPRILPYHRHYLRNGECWRISTTFFSICTMMTPSSLFILLRVVKTSLLPWMTCIGVIRETERGKVSLRFCCPGSYRASPVYEEPTTGLFMPNAITNVYSGSTVRSGPSYNPNFIPQHGRDHPSRFYAPPPSTARLGALFFICHRSFCGA